MSTPKEASTGLSLRRILEAQTSVTFQCAPGKITVLKDDDAVRLKLYHKVLAGQANEERIFAEFSGAAYNPKTTKFVGFGEKFAEKQSIEQFLEQVPFSPEEIKHILASFDLQKLTYLTCEQLSPTAGRQLLLLEALAGDAPVLVLKDPFQPFNGRWRESFARQLLDYTKETNCILIIFSLSFMPQCWATREEIITIDLAEITEEAVQKIAREKAAEKANAEGEKKTRAFNPLSEKYYGKKIRIPLPDNLVYAYRGTRDYIIEGIASTVEKIRYFSGVFAVLGCAILLFVMAFVMLPNFSEQRHKLAQLVSDARKKWSEAPVTPENQENEVKLKKKKKETKVIEPVKTAEKKVEDAVTVSENTNRDENPTQINLDPPVVALVDGKKENLPGSPEVVNSSSGGEPSINTEEDITPWITPYMTLLNGAPEELFPAEWLSLSDNEIMSIVPEGIPDLPVELPEELNALLTEEEAPQIESQSSKDN